MGKTLSALLCGSVLMLSTPSTASATADYLEDAGIGTATVAANVFYIPAKLTYATLGGITGGLAYLLTGTNREIAERVWTPSMGGDYVLRRQHIRGEEIIYFSAPRPRTDDGALNAESLPPAY
ncbi:MAG: hypothetical protein OXC18_07150 [Desulfurellaceae bacterium]|nr:hypothetical protein [Desulfurellaceae bacterium]